MPVVIDDHLVRDVLAGSRPRDLAGLAQDGIATTGLWLFRLCAALAQPASVRRLAAPVADLPADLQAVFRSELVALPSWIEMVSLRELAWPMAELHAHHRAAGRHLSALTVEALATAHRLGGGIAVSARDVGPNLRAAAAADGVEFHVL